VGYLPGEFALYEHMTGRDYLGFLAALRGGVAADQIDSLAERLQSDHREDRVALARQQAELGLIQAFMPAPS
jgi:ABC-2 type transport system ATP-binding protein